MKLYTGCVENRQDPLKLGRCQVRVVGLHNYDKTQLKTEDLPWAYPMQPITSAGISGIGHTPLGPVEGTWVVIMFRDDDEQQPIILGSIGGIPQAQGNIDQDNDQMILKQDGFLAPANQQTITDSDGSTVSNQSDTPVEENVGLNPATSYTASDDAVDLIKKYEGLKLTAYQDSVGVWTIGYGTTSINGVPVYPGQTITKDGVPSVTGDLTQVNTPANEPVDSTATSSGLSNNGNNVSLGFKDPKGKYPLYLNEPDTNKLARHEDIKKTIVYKKELARDMDVVSYGVTWSQSPIPYNSKYPFNHVFMTESGHIMEFDDTPYSERIHIFHKSGTFTEIDANGTQVNRIVGDSYEILERNGYVHIKGAVNITVEGDANIQVNNNANMNVRGNMNTAVAGAYNLKAGSINLESTGSTNIYSGNSLNLQTAAAMNQKAAATWNVDAARVDINDGTAGSANQTELSLPDAAEEPPTFEQLVVITRGVEAAAHYETPDEGDPSEYIQKRLNDGTLKADEQNSGTAQGSTTATPNNVAPLPQSCNIINGMDKFTADLQLSTHFTLGALTSNGTRMPVNQQGLTAQEIVCNLKGLCENVLEPIINLYPSMIITSGFRRPGDVAKSSATSQHYLGQAADIVIPGFSREKHYEAIQAIQQIVPYDELILEYSGSNTVWIHASFKYTANRQLAFTMRDHQRYGSVGQYTLIA